MEKKLKINFILKGIAIFAFVAFCLLAILAGVTLPFVSNASTADSAVIVSESDCATASSQTQNLVPGIDYTLPSYIKTVKRFSDLTVGEKVYGFALDEVSVSDFWSITSELGADYAQGKQYALRNVFKLQESNYYVHLEIYFDSNRTKFSFGGFNFLTMPENEDDFASFGGGDLAVFYLSTKTNSSTVRSFGWNYFLFPELTYTNQTVSADLVSPAVDMIDSLKNQFWFITEINSGTTETITVTNYGFQSRFGYVDSIPSSNMYVNLQEKPTIPDSVRRVTVENTDDLTNGWIHKDYEYFLPLVNSYDGFGNPVDGGFTGWHLINIEVNGVHSSNYSVYFEVLNQRVYDLGTATITNGYVTVGLTDKDKYLVESNFTNSENLLVFSKSNTSFKYYLQPNISQNDVYKFFALIDYRNYSPADNDFYVAGFNSASKGYYDNGYKNGYSAGNTDGYKIGYTAGDSKGYQRGLSDGGNYSFLSLFGAIFDAPIQALFGGTQRLPAGTKITDSSGKTITLTSDTVVNRGGMLNFELMGVNLSGFVLALFSLSIIIVVIKFALAKK